MRALTVTAPHVAEVADVPPPSPGVGEVVVDVELAGICGTDVELFTGEMAYLHQGYAAYPLRLGHEWCGRVSAVGDGVDQVWVGRRVTGDTMLGCGACARCLSGKHHVCEFRHEIGIRGGWPGGLAEQLPVPVTALLEVPESLSPTAAAMIEPGGGALRAVRAAALSPGQLVLILGAGTMGLLCMQFAESLGALVHVADTREGPLRLAHDLGARQTWLVEELTEHVSYDAVIDASPSRESPARAISLVEPGGRVVFIGLSEEPSLIDSRDLLFKDLTATAILGASAGLAGAIAAYADGSVNPEPLVAHIVGLDEVASILGGQRPPLAGPGPKILVDPRRPAAPATLGL